MKRPDSYVGVSGVVSTDQAEVLRSLSAGLLEKRRLALGFKAVHKTQWLDVENKYGPDWYPVGDDIRTAMDTKRRPREFRVAQTFLDIADAKGQGIEDYERRFVNKLLGRTACNLDGIQFDLLPWHVHDYRDLFDEIKAKRPSMEILLQCQGPIMEELGPIGAMKTLDRYEGHVDHVLFDASHGTGTAMDPDALVPFVNEAAERDWLGVGVAGGLNGDRVRQFIPPLVSRFPMLSFDAEGQLHKNEDGGSMLNLELTMDYLQAAEEVIR